jgi:hypothetical protein
MSAIHQIKTFSANLEAELDKLTNDWLQPMNNTRTLPEIIDINFSICQDQGNKIRYAVSIHYKQEVSS